MEEVQMTYWNRVATDLRKLYTATQPIKRTDLLSVKKQEARVQSRHNTFGNSIRDLSVLRSELCRRCLTGRAMAEMTTRRILSTELVLSLPLTTEAWYRSGVQSGITS